MSQPRSLKPGQSDYPSPNKRRQLESSEPERHAEASAGSAEVPLSIDNHKTAYRATRIPEHYDEESFADALAQALQLPNPSDLKIRSFAADTSDSKRPTDRTATMSFLREPAFLSMKSTPSDFGKKEALNQRRILLASPGSRREDTIYIDKHFSEFTPLSPLKNDEEHVIDCIAIHGWGGHAYGSFKASNEPYMWLRDTLATEEPKLRVWTYGYESSLKNADSTESIDDYAETFMSLLCDMRQATERSGTRIRPMIFIVHSLGGLIFKQAIISMSKSTDSTHKLNLNSIYGALFFGVPNKGMDVEDLVAMIGDKPARYDLSLLDKEVGHRLQNRQHQEFCDAFYFKDSEIIQFFETHKTAGSQRNKIIVDPDSATGGRHWENTNEYKININADHRSMVKFSENDRNSYVKVRNSLQRLQKRAFAVVEARISERSIEVVLNDEQKACLDSLRFPLMNSRADNVSKPLEATFSWIWEDSKVGFHTWLRDEQPIYWIKGKPGSGKSTLLKHMLDRCNFQKHQAEIIVSFFFNSRGSEMERSMDGFFRSIIYQILSLHHPAFHHIPEKFREKGAECAHLEKRVTSWDTGTLENTFQAVVSDKSLNRIVIFIDALDECNEVSHLIDFLREVVKQPKHQSPLLKLCCSSRPEAKFIGLFKKPPGLSLQEFNSTDIRVCVEKVAQDFIEMDGSHCKITDLLENIIERANGVVLWAKLVTKDLFAMNAEGAKFYELEKVLSSIPTDLQALYRNMTKKIEKTHELEGRELLRIVLCAREPVCLLDLQHAWEFGRTSSSPESPFHGHQIEISTNDQYRRRIQSRCGGLLEETSESERVQFIHRTVQQFIQNDEEYLKHEVEGGPYRSGHLFMLAACIECLAKAASEVLAGKTIAQISSKPMVAYTTKFWIEHWREAENLGMPRSSLGKLASPKLQILQIWAQLRYAIYRVGPKYPGEISMLALAAEYNIPRYITEKLEEGCNVNDASGRYGTLLTTATSRGYELLVRLLLDSGADVNTQSGYDGTALHAAARSGNVKVMQLLLDSGADVNMQSGYVGTALHAAAMRSNMEVVRLLLDSGAGVNAQSEHYGTALRAAAKRSNVAIVQWLLDSGADITTKSKYHDSTLHAAIISDDIEMVQLLLNSGANVNTQSEYNGTALQAAAKRSSIEMVRLLLDSGVDVNTRSGYYGTALHAAAMNDKH